MTRSRTIAVVSAVTLAAVGVFAAQALAATPDRDAPDDEMAVSLLDEAWPVNDDGTRAVLPPIQIDGMDSSALDGVDEFHRQVAEGTVPVAMGAGGVDTGYISGEAFSALPAQGPTDVHPVHDESGNLVAWWANPWGIIPLEELDDWDFALGSPH